VKSYKPIETSLRIVKCMRDAWKIVNSYKAKFYMSLQFKARF